MCYLKGNKIKECRKLLSFQGGGSSLVTDPSLCWWTRHNTPGDAYLWKPWLGAQLKWKRSYPTVSDRLGSQLQVLRGKPQQQFKWNFIMFNENTHFTLGSPKDLRKKSQKYLYSNCFFLDNQRWKKNTTYLILLKTYENNHLGCPDQSGFSQQLQVPHL